MLDKMVALATLVIPRPPLSDQFAQNQRKQKTDANCAVSRVVRCGREAESGGSRSYGLFMIC
jgi:hypothetical protein